MNADECFEQGMLRKGKVEVEKINGSIEISKDFLNKADKVFEINEYGIAFLMAYNSMFHSARALLFKYGVTERSHFCMILYLKEKFRENSELLDFLNIMDSYRGIRHKIQYGGENYSELDGSEAIKDAKGFLEKVENFVKNQ